MKKANNRPEPALYLQIRRYVVSLALNNKCNQQPLPSLGKLMALFKASRPTVCKAIRALQDEGLVISKPGIGIFTAPDNDNLFLLSDIDLPQIVGIIVGDGREIGYFSSMARRLGQLLNHSSRYQLWMRPLNLASGNTPEDIAQQLERERLNAIIALEGIDSVHTPLMEALTILKQRGMKVVTGEVEHPNFTSVRMNYEGLGRRIGREMLARDAKSIFFFPNQNPWSMELDSIRSEYHAAGKQLDERFCISTHDSDVKIGQVLVDAVRNNPDIRFVCIKVVPTHNYEKYLLANAPDVLEKCIFIGESDDFDFSATKMKLLGFQCPEEDYALTILKEVRRQLDGDDTVRHIVLPEEAFNLMFINS